MTTERAGQPRRRWGRCAVVIGAALVALAVLAAVVSQTAWFRSRLRAQVEARLNAVLLGKVTLGGLEGNLFGTIGLRDLRIALDGARVLAVRRAVVHYDPAALLLGRRLVVTAAAVDGLAVRLVEDERGWNVARLVRQAPAAPQESTVEAALADVEIRDAALTIVRPGAAWKFRQLALTGTAEFGRAGSVIGLTGATGTLPGRRLRIETLAGRLVADVSGVTVDDLVLRTDASEVRARLSVPHDDAQERAASVEITRLSAAEMRRLVRAWAPVADLSGRLAARGPMAAVAVDAALTSVAGEAAVTGTVDLSRAPAGYDLRATVTHLDTAALLGPRHPASDLSGSVSVRGSGTTPGEATGTFTLALRDSTLAETPFQTLTAQGTLAARRLEIDAAAVTANGRAHARGVLAAAEERYELDATFVDFDPAPFINRLNLPARLNGTLTVRGTGFALGAASGELHAALTASKVGAVEIRGAQVDLRAARGTLAVERATVRSNVADAEASGSLALAPHLSAAAPDAAASALGRDLSRASGTLRYEVRAADLSPLAATVGAVPLAGRASIIGSASGSVGALEVRARGEAHDLARNRLAAGMLAVEVRASRLGAADARIDLSARAREVRAGGLRFAALDAKAWWARAGGDTAQAALDLDLRQDDAHRHGTRVEATLRPRELEAHVSALRADLGGETWTATGTPTIVRRADRVTIAGLVVRSPTGVASLEGSAGTSGAQDLTLTIDGLALGFLAPSLGEHAGGRLSAVAHLRGTAASPEIDAEASIAAPTVGATRYQGMQATLRAAAGDAVVAARVTQEGGREGGRQLTLDAAFPLEIALAPLRLRAGGGLTGTIKAEAIDLAFLGPALPEVAHLGGRLDAELTLAGTLAAPQVRGALAVTGGRASVIPLGLNYDPVELRAGVDGQTLTLERLRVVSGGGSLEADGTAALTSDGAATDVRLTLARFPLYSGDYGEGAASGTITVRGGTRAPVVTGRLTTDRLVLKIPESLPGSVRPPDPTITVVGPGALPERAVRPMPAVPEDGPHAPVPTLYERAAIDLALDVPRDAWIRRSDANIELRGALAGRKLPGEAFHLTGEIDAERGWYSFQGKKLTLSEGRVTFTGEGFDPLLHLVAVHDADAYTVRVIVGGTITKPALTLESDPPLEQGDILSVLLFGRPAGRLSQAESTGLREQAISVAGSYAAAELRQSAADVLGLDNLEFNTGTQGLVDSKVSLGKYIASDVFISLAHRFGKQNVEELRIEYRVTPQWSVETSSDTLGDSGIDAFWKKRY